MQAWKENKKPSPNYYAELQAVFFSAVLGCHHRDFLSLNLEQNVLLCFEQNVKSWLTPSEFPPGSNLKVDYGQSSSSKFIPERNTSQMLEMEEELHATNTTVLLSCKHTQSESCEMLRYFITLKYKQLLCLSASHRVEDQKEESGNWVLVFYEHPNCCSSHALKTKHMPSHCCYFSLLFRVWVPNFFL